MFEAAQEQKQSSSNRMLVTIFVVVAAAAVGGVLYTMSKSGSKPDGAGHQLQPVRPPHPKKRTRCKT